MTSDPNSASVPKSKPKFWRTALLLAGSAAFGGLAVALWNRRELTQMRNHGNDSDSIQEGAPGLASAESEEETF
jgi:hypothetical protein